MAFGRVLGTPHGRTAPLAPPCCHHALPDPLSRSSAWLTLLKAGLTVILLGVIVRLADLDQLLALAQTASIPLILLALAVQPFNMLLEGIMWHLWVQVEVPDQPLRHSLGAMLCGYALGFFTPASIGEFAGRAYYLEHDDKWALSALVLAERALAMAVVVIIGAGALAIFLATHSVPFEGAWTTLLLIGSLLGGLLFAAILMPRPTYRLLGWLATGDRIQRHLSFLTVITHKRITGLIGLGLVRYAAYVVQFFILLRAFLPDVFIGQGVHGILLVFYAKFLIPSITLLDLGIREGAAVFFFGQLGLAEAVGLNASLLVFALNLVVPALVGLPFLFRLRLTSFGERLRLPTFRSEAVAPEET